MAKAVIRLAPLAFALAGAGLSGCASVPEMSTVSPEGSPVALGQSVSVGNLVATPMAVAKDSRCPENARCVWAGQLVVTTRVDGTGWRETLDLTLGEPENVRDTQITLVSGLPEQQAQGETDPRAYRFVFAGGD